jgi:aconitate hydratase
LLQRQGKDRIAKREWLGGRRLRAEPLQFESPEDYEQVKQGDILVLQNLHERIRSGESFELFNKARERRYRVRHFLSRRQVDMVMAGSLINIARKRVPERP